MGMNPNLNKDNKICRQTKETLERERRNSILTLEGSKFEVPKELTEEEAVVWNDVVKRVKMCKGGYVSDVDRDLMITYARSKVEYDNACMNWKNNPSYYIPVDTGNINKDGETVYALKKNPSFEIKTKYCDVLLKLLNALGLSPLGRAKQGMAASKKECELKKEKIMDLFNTSDEENEDNDENDNEE